MYDSYLRIIVQYDANVNQIIYCFISQNSVCTVDILFDKVLKALNFICKLVLNTDGYNSRLTMASCDEPARKKRVTESSIDFRLCVLCQGDKFTDIKGVHQLEHLRQPEVESYQPLLDCIYNRAQYQNPEYVRLNQPSVISGKELNILNAGWHKSCHGKQLTNNTLRETNVES